MELVFEMLMFVASSLSVRYLHRGAGMGKVRLPPGTYLGRIAEFFCRRKTYRQVFEPLLAEFQHEYLEALLEDRLFHAKWLRVLYFVAFCNAAQMNLIGKLLKRLWSAFRGA